MVVIIEAIQKKWVNKNGKYKSVTDVRKNWKKM